MHAVVWVLAVFLRRRDSQKKKKQNPNTKIGKVVLFREHGDSGRDGAVAAAVLSPLIYNLRRWSVFGHRRAATAKRKTTDWPPSAEIWL